MPPSWYGSCFRAKAPISELIYGDSILQVRQMWLSVHLPCVQVSIVELELTDCG